MSNTTTALLINNLFDSSAESARAISAINESARLTERNALLDQGQRISDNLTRLAQEDAMNLQRKLSAAEAALAVAQATCRDWQAAMEAMRDLSGALRDEIKACPNEEAHHFGKNLEARNKRLTEFEDKRRIELGLKPKYKS